MINFTKEQIEELNQIHKIPEKIELTPCFAIQMIMDSSKLKKTARILIDSPNDPPLSERI